MANIIIPRRNVRIPSETRIRLLDSQGIVQHYWQVMGDMIISHHPTIDGIGLMYRWGYYRRPDGEYYAVSDEGIGCRVDNQQRLHLPIYAIWPPGTKEGLETPKLDGTIECHPDVGAGPVADLYFGPDELVRYATSEFVPFEQFLRGDQHTMDLVVGGKAKPMEKRYAVWRRRLRSEQD